LCLRRRAPCRAPRDSKGIGAPTGAVTVAETVAPTVAATAVAIRAVVVIGVAGARAAGVGTVGAGALAVDGVCPMPNTIRRGPTPNRGTRRLPRPVFPRRLPWANRRRSRA